MGAGCRRWREETNRGPRLVATGFLSSKGLLIGHLALRASAAARRLQRPVRRRLRRAAGSSGRFRRPSAVERAPAFLQCLAAATTKLREDVLHARNRAICSSRATRFVSPKVFQVGAGSRLRLSPAHRGSRESRSLPSLPTQSPPVCPRWTGHTCACRPDGMPRVEVPAPSSSEPPMLAGPLSLPLARLSAWLPEPLTSSQLEPVTWLSRHRRGAPMAPQAIPRMTMPGIVKFAVFSTRGSCSKNRRGSIRPLAMHAVLPGWQVLLVGYRRHGPPWAHRMAISRRPESRLTGISLTRLSPSRCEAATSACNRAAQPQQVRLHMLVTVTLDRLPGDGPLWTGPHTRPLRGAQVPQCFSGL